MYGTIVVPVDGSEASRHAAEHALELAESVDAVVHFLHVVSLNESRNVDVQRIERGYLYQDLEELGQKVIDESLPPLDAFSVPTERTVRVGRPDNQIVSFIDANQPDLVIMGTRGRTGLKRILLGSIAANVAGRSNAPVKLVQPRQDEENPSTDTHQEESGTERPTDTHQAESRTRGNTSDDEDPATDDRKHDG